MKTILKWSLIALAFQLCFAVFTGFMVAPEVKIPVFPGLLCLSGWTGAFFFPMLTAIIIIYGYIDTRLNRKRNPTRFDKSYPPFAYINFLFIFSLQFFGTLAGMDTFKANSNHLGMIIGIYLVLTGNLWPRMPFKPIGGWPIPWIFKSENIWKKTNRLTGYTLVIAGLIVFIINILGLLINKSSISLTLFRSSFWVICILILIPIPYSYIIHKINRNG